MDNYTKNGLLLIFIGLIIGMIGTIISSAYYSVYTVETSTGFIGGILTTMISGIGGLITLIGAIFLFVGRKEFGESHRKFIIYALIIIVIGIIASTVLVSAVVFFAITSSIGGETESATSIISPVMFISTLVAAITGGLAYLLALYHLEDQRGKYFLYAAFFISIITASIMGILIMDVTAELFNEISIEQSSDITSSFAYSSTVSRYAIFGILGNIFWAFAVYLPYKRIKDGELVPIPSETFSSSGAVPDRVCPNCNKAIPNDANNCPYCGKSFDSYI